MKNPIRFGLIADGVHTHNETLRLAYRANSNNLVLVTDAVAAMGLPMGKHFIGMNTLFISLFFQFNIWINLLLV